MSPGSKPHLSDHARGKAQFLLRNHWRPDAIAKDRDIRAGRSTIYGYEQRLQTYGSLQHPHARRRGRPGNITVAAKDGLQEHLLNCPWLYQDEMVAYLEEEWDIQTSRPAVGRFLKEIKWSNKLGKFIHDRRSEDLRLA